MTSLVRLGDDIDKVPLQGYQTHFVTNTPVSGYPKVAVHKERKNFPKNGFKKYISSLKDIPSKGEIERQRRRIRAKQKRRPDVATLEMKLTDSYSRPGTSGHSQGMADLKLGMNCINNRTGIQQNTTSLFHTQYPEKEEPVVKEPVIKDKIPCLDHKGYRKATLDQRNPYILQGRKRPLTNLSPYLKEFHHITEEEEKKILEMINIFRNRARRWDDYEEERFRRFLEVQDPEFREKLLECMKEHIQETNLIDSFFKRYRTKHLPFKRSQTQGYADRAKNLKKQTQEARDKIMSRYKDYSSQASTVKEPKEETKLSSKAESKRKTTKEKDVNQKENFHTNQRERDFEPREDQVQDSKGERKCKKRVKIQSHTTTMK